MVRERGREYPSASPEAQSEHDLPREATSEVIVPEAFPENTDLDQQRIEELQRENENVIDEKKENARHHAQAGLEALAKYLGPLLQEGTIFASTALFLLAQKKREAGDTDWEKFDVPPGDLDVAVNDYQTLVKIREQLANIPGVVFKNEGRFGTFKGQEDTKILAGEFPVIYEATENGARELRKKMYDFEFFYKTRMVPEEEMAQSIVYNGYRILNPDSLLRQYELNKAHESRVDREVQKTVQFLTSPELHAFREAIEQDKDIPDLEEHIAQGIQDMHLKRSEMKRFYELQQFIEEVGSDNPIEGTEEYKKLQDAISERATVLSGYKTKLWKRFKNVQQLSEERAAHIPSLESPEALTKAA